MKDTSIEAFHGIRGDGTLNLLQLKVLVALLDSEVSRQMQPPTARELIKFHRAPDGAWKRLSELERNGYIVQAGTRKCSCSGRKASTWRINRREQGELDFGKKERTD